jgi:hypothetical protein
MLTDQKTYRQTLIALYLRLPDTPRRLSRFDLHLLDQLWRRQIPLTVIETAFLLASLRRAARRPDAIPLGPIRSLHYHAASGIMPRRHVAWRRVGLSSLVKSA